MDPQECCIDNNLLLDFFRKIFRIRPVEKTGHNWRWKTIVIHREKGNGK